MKKLLFAPLVAITVLGSVNAQAELRRTTPDHQVVTSTSTKTTAVHKDASAANVAPDTVVSDRVTTRYEAADSTTTTVTEKDLNTTGLNNQIFSVTPQVGAMHLRDTDGNVLNRGVAGLTAEFNGTGVVNQTFGRGATNIYSGITTGLFYSHVGTASSTGIFGANNAGTNPAADGTHLLMIPANLKVGYSFGNLLLGVHGGGNVFYRSIARTAAVGQVPNSTGNSDWSILPNIGFDVQYNVNRQIAVLLRPDWTMAGSNSIVTATLGATLSI